MPRNRESVYITRRLAHPLPVVFALVSDVGRQKEWMPGDAFHTCRVQHATGPLRGPEAVHIRVLLDDEDKETIHRLVTSEFEDDELVAFSDGRFFEVEAEGDGTTVLYGQELVISTGVGRMLRKAFKSEDDLLPEGQLETEMDRIEELLAADVERAKAEAAAKAEAE